MSLVKQALEEARLYFNKFVWPELVKSRGLPPEANPNEADFQAFLKDIDHLFSDQEQEEDKRWEKL